MSTTASSITIRELRARPVMAPLARPITTSSVSIPAAPLVLIDLVCDHDFIGQAYIFAYTKAALRPLVEMMGGLSELVQGEEIAPLALAQKLDSAFCLLGKQGLLGMALSGLDMALWDVLGKTAGTSVARLLGANHDPIKCYDSHGLFNPDTSPEHLERSLELGFEAVKIKIGGSTLQADIDAIRSVRGIVGPDVRLMVDYNQSLTVPEATRRIRYLEKFDLYWVEEPVRAEDLQGHSDVRSASSIAIQTGENWWFPRGAAHAYSVGASDFSMLDIMKIGGFSGWVQAAALAEAASSPVSSHLFIEASTHAMAATTNRDMIEHLDVAGAVLAEPYQVSDGKLAPRGPGFGISWDEQAVEKHLV